MNECLRYQEMISALIDGEISGKEHSALLEHMEGCRRCSAMYAAFSEVSAIAAVDMGALPEGLHENIMAGVRRASIEKNNRRRGVRHFKSIIAAAACFAVVLFAVGGVITELSRSNTVRSEAALTESANMTVVTDAIATMDVQAAGTANAAVYARANMSVPTAIPEAATEAYDVDTTAGYMDSAADPYLAIPEPTAVQPTAVQPTAAQPAAVTATESVAAYEALPESTPAPAMEIAPAYESLTESAETAATAVFAAPAQPLQKSEENPQSVPTDIAAAVSPETEELKIRLGDKAVWKELSDVLLPFPAEENKTVALPEGYCDTLYILIIESEGAAPEEIFVLRYGELLLLSLPDGQEISGKYQTQCTAEAFEALIAPFPAA